MRGMKWKDAHDRRIGKDIRLTWDLWKWYPKTRLEWLRRTTSTLIYDRCFIGPLFEPDTWGIQVKGVQRICCGKCTVRSSKNMMGSSAIFFLILATCPEFQSKHIKSLWEIYIDLRMKLRPADTFVPYVVHTWTFNNECTAELLQFTSTLDPVFLFHRRKEY
jgi:hypothetical protein